MSNVIEEVAVATIRSQLPAPVAFGDWVMNHREFAVVRLRSTSGHEGWAFTLSREGAVLEQIQRSIAPIYQGASVGSPAQAFRSALRSNLACHSSGVGLRALSIVDLAMWDLAARCAEQPIVAYLNGTAQSMPATAIVGYPPHLTDGGAVREQVLALRERGWDRFKMPIAATTELSLERLHAGREAAPTSWIGCDAAWMFDDVESAAQFAFDATDVGLGWFEDVFPPGNAARLHTLRNRIATQIAMGDEQGGSYYPDALIAAQAVDVVRIDLTCMGGISGGRQVVDTCVRAGVLFAPHMFAHVHSQVFGAWGFHDVPIEWGVPWTGVDPYADSLQQPTIDNAGRMAPLDPTSGFGQLINREWAHDQPHFDPSGILRQTGHV